MLAVMLLLLAVVSGTAPVSNLAAGTLDAQGAQDGLSASFYYPHGIALDSMTGTLYAADTFDNKISRISPDGLVSTLAGSSAIRSQDDDKGF